MTTTAIVAILAVGIVVVIGSVLVLRLHAFLALILGALAVGALTPGDVVRQAALSKALRPVDGVDAKRNNLEIAAKELVFPPGAQLEIFQRDARTGELNHVGRGIAGTLLHRISDAGTHTVQMIDVPATTPVTSLRVATYLVTPTDLKEAEKFAAQTFVQRVTAGFGTTCGNIGILIAMASIIGKCLLDSGAADRIVRSTLRLLGERGAPAAFLSSGFLLGIPVFFDTVFYLMIPLGKAMRMRVGRNYLLYVLTIVSGATMAHSLVPPTPGPLFVAEQLGVRVGDMILAGMVVGIFTALFGYFYATVANRLWELPLRPSPDFSLEDLEKIARRDESLLPSLIMSLLPIILPVVLIGGATVLDTFQDSLPTASRETVLGIAKIAGDKNIALIVSAAIAMFTLIRQKRCSLGDLADSVQKALASGGVIILITAAGGAFGTVLQQTGVAGLVGDVSAADPRWIVALAFLITAGIRTAQGSATVAMITSVGILSGIATADQLGFHPVYLALAIGCGSKPIAWMNDSGFWVIGKMSGMTEAETLKFVTPMTTCMGLVGLVVVMIGVTVLPLV